MDKLYFLVSKNRFVRRDEILWKIMNFMTGLAIFKVDTSNVGQVWCPAAKITTSQATTLVYYHINLDCSFILN